MPPRRTYRRITSQDNSTTLPHRTTFPVGTFTAARPQYSYPAGSVNLAATSNPSTAAAGSLGAPGAMLPARLPNNPQYRPPGNLQRPATSPNMTTANSFGGWNAQNAAAVSQAQRPPVPGQYLGQGTYLQSERNLQSPLNSVKSPADRAPQFVGFAAAMQNYTAKFDAAAEQFELTGTVDPKTLPPAVSVQGQQALGYGAEQMQAMGYSFNGQNWVNQQAGTQPKPGGNSDFTQTGFMQQYAANNVSFVNQLRWDPDRGKFVKIGKLINEGRLDVKDPKARLKKRKKGGGDEQTSAPAAAPVTPTGGSSTGGSFGVSTG